MAISSVNLEGALIKSSNQAASKAALRNGESNFVTPFEKGSYILLPQSHFNIDVKYQGDTYASSRLAVAYVTGKTVKYARSLKISDLFGTLATTVGTEKAETETRKAPNGANVVRIKRGQLPNSARAITKGCLFKSVQGDDFHIDEPVILKFVDTLEGMNPIYQQNAQGDYDVVTDDNGIAIFEAAQIYQIEVSDCEDAALMAAAKAAIMADKNLGGLARLD